MFKITCIKPIDANPWTALCIYTKEDANIEDLAALGLPKYVGQFKPNYKFTINLSPTNGNPINERGLKRVKAFLDKAAAYCEVSEGAVNACSISEFREIHGI